MIAFFMLLFFAPKGYFTNRYLLWAMFDILVESLLCLGIIWGLD